MLVSTPREQAESAQPSNPPLRALDYESPQPRGRRGWNVWIGIVAAFFLALGTGITMAGVMLAQHVRDEIAFTLGFGTGFLVLGISFGLLFWLRHSSAR